MRRTKRLRLAESGSRAGAAKTPGRWLQQWPTSTTEDGARKKGGAVTLERSPETDDRNCELVISDAAWDMRHPPD